MALAPNSREALGAMRRLESEIEEVFTRMIDLPWGRITPSRVTAWPSIDLYETEDAYILVANMPGVARKDIDLRVHGRRIVLCGTCGTDEPAWEGECVLTERPRGRFCRVVALDHPIDGERAEATHQDGIFKARLPKLREECWLSSGEGRP